MTETSGGAATEPPSWTAAPKLLAVGFATLFLNQLKDYIPESAQTISLILFGLAALACSIIFQWARDRVTVHKWAYASFTILLSLAGLAILTTGVWLLAVAFQQSDTGVEVRFLTASLSVVAVGEFCRVYGVELMASSNRLGEPMRAFIAGPVYLAAIVIMGASLAVLGFRISDSGALSKFGAFSATYVGAGFVIMGTSLEGIGTSTSSSDSEFQGSAHADSRTSVRSTVAALGAAASGVLGTWAIAGLKADAGYGLLFAAAFGITLLGRTEGAQARFVCLAVGFAGANSIGAGLFVLARDYPDLSAVNSIIGAVLLGAGLMLSGLTVRTACGSLRLYVSKDALRYRDSHAALTRSGFTALVGLGSYLGIAGVIVIANDARWVQGAPIALIGLLLTINVVALKLAAMTSTKDHSAEPFDLLIPERVLGRVFAPLFDSMREVGILRDEDSPPFILDGEIGPIVDLEAIAPFHKERHGHLTTIASWFVLLAVGLFLLTTGAPAHGGVMVVFSVVAISEWTLGRIETP